MTFVVLGVLLCALKLLDIGPTAAWSWWVTLAPFPLAMAWWAWSDSSGRTRRLAMDKLEQKKEDRRRKAMVGLGIDPRKHDKQTKATAAYMAARERKTEQVESKRDASRQKNRQSVINSRQDTSRLDAVGPETRPLQREPGGEL